MTSQEHSSEECSSLPPPTAVVRQTAVGGKGTLSELYDAADAARRQRLSFCGDTAQEPFIPAGVEIFDLTGDSEDEGEVEG